MSRARTVLRALWLPLLATLVWLLRLSWRVRWVGPRSGSAPRLLAFWHGDQLALTCLPRPLTALVSQSGDGELAARVMRRLGFQAVRGSSNRGAVAGGLGLVRCLRRGGCVAVAVDGPRGPRHRADDGVLRLAARASAPVVPVAAAARRRWVLSSWDRFTIPAPFTTIYVVRGERVASGVESALAGVWRQAQALAGRHEGGPCDPATPRRSAAARDGPGGLAGSLRSAAAAGAARAR